MLPKVTRAFVAGKIVLGTYFDLFTNFVKKNFPQYKIFHKYYSFGACVSGVTSLIEPVFLVLRVGVTS